MFSQKMETGNSLGFETYDEKEKPDSNGAEP